MLSCYAYLCHLPISMTKPQLKILFICRGSAYDGIGHVIRSRTVARAMREVALVKLVVIGEAYVDNLLADRGLDHTTVTHDDQAMHIYREFMPDVVIFDLLYLDETVFQAISQSTITVGLSPIFNCLSRLDLLFHRTAIPDENWPINGTKPLIRSGLEYAVVCEHCYRIPEDFYRQNLKIETLSVAISMGGTDAANKTLQVLNTIKQVPEKLFVWVLLGEGYMHSYQDLVDCMRRSRHEIILAKANDSMWRILSMCSLAILAGGTTTYEAAYAGLPSINTLEAEEHFFLIQELVEKGVCLCAGHTFPESLRILNDRIIHLNRNRHELLALHLRSKRLIDGLGAQRIIEVIQEYYQKHHHNVDATKRKGL